LQQASPQQGSPFGQQVVPQQCSPGLQQPLDGSQHSMPLPQHFDPHFTGFLGGQAHTPDLHACSLPQQAAFVSVAQHCSSLAQHDPEPPLAWPPPRRLNGMQAFWPRLQQRLKSSFPQNSLPSRQQARPQRTGHSQYPPSDLTMHRSGGLQQALPPQQCSIDSQQLWCPERGEGVGQHTVVFWQHTGHSY
jgi:hypothetical protein